MTATNKKIADQLTRIAHQSRGTGEKCVVLRIGSFTIKCRDSRDHILAVAYKYQHARPLTTKQRKDWGVWGSKLNRNVIGTRYATDWDRDEFYKLVTK